MTDTSDMSTHVPREFWVDAAEAMAFAADLGTAFDFDADPTDRRALVLAAIAMRADVRSFAPGSVGSRLVRLAALVEQAAAFADASGDHRLEGLGRDLDRSRRALESRADARITYALRASREARRRRALALRPLSELAPIGRESK